jgi:photosystem II stability/assembly factor-like uncharacterized protein
MTLVCLSPNGVDRYVTEQAPDSMLVATLRGVVRLKRPIGGTGWTAASAGLAGLHVSSLMREPSRGMVFAGIHGTGLYRSRDDGKRWSLAMSGIESGHVFSLAHVETPAGIELYAGTEPARLYRSTDYGDTWRELTALRSVPGHEAWNFPAPPHIAHVKHVTFDPRDSRTIYVCIEQGALLKSQDGGESFREIQFQDETYVLNKDTHRIVFNPRNPDEIYLDGGDGIARSRDAGKSWEHLTTPAMRIAYPDHLYCSPEEEGVLFVAGGGTPPNIWRQTGDARSAIARSADGGRNWTQVRGGLPEALAGNIEAVTLVSWPGGFGFFAGTTDGEVFASYDKGRSWSLIADKLGPVTKSIHLRNIEMGRANVRNAAQPAQ